MWEYLGYGRALVADLPFVMGGAEYFDHNRGLNPIMGFAHLKEESKCSSLTSKKGAVTTTWTDLEHSLYTW